jgi:hypothetical protein
MSQSTVLAVMAASAVGQLAASGTSVCLSAGTQNQLQGAE